MTTPILHGSPRAQKNYITPNSQGITGRNTNLGYTTPVGIGRYQLPPPVIPPPPPIATGYGNWFQATGEGSPPTNVLADVSIEKYTAASDTMTANSITVAPLAPPGLQPTWEGQFVNTFFPQNSDNSTQNGSNTHGYFHTLSPNQPNLNLYNIRNMLYFPYSNATTQNNLVDLKRAERQGQIGVNDKANGYGLRILGATPGNSALFLFTQFPFANETYVNGTEVGATVPGVSPSNPVNEAGRRNAMATQDLNAAFYVGGQGGPVALITNTGLVIKFPFANYGADTRLTGLDPWGASTSEAWFGAGVSGTTHGYSLGGVVVNPGTPTPSTVNTDVMQKYPFTTEGDVGSSNVGNLSIAVSKAHGSATNTTGYLSGGYSTYPNVNAIRTIQAFPFASDTTTAGVSDILRSQGQWGRGTSET